MPVLPVFEIPVRLTGGYQSGPSLNVWHVQEEISTAAQAIVDAFGTFYLAIRSIYSPGISIAIAPDGVKSYNVDPPIIHGVTPGATTSTGTGSGAPQLAACTTLRTGIASRSGRGRKFFGPLSAEAEADGQLTVDAQTTIVNAMGTLLANLTTLGSPLVVFSRLVPAAYQVTSTSTDRILDTLRSRAF